MAINPTLWVLGDPIADELVNSEEAEPEAHAGNERIKSDERPSSIMFNTIRDRYDSLSDFADDDDWLM